MIAAADHSPPMLLSRKVTIMEGRSRLNGHLRLTPPRRYVHQYEDHSKDPVVMRDTTPQRGATRQFPTKLYEMLSQASEDGFDDIVSWQPHGRAFLVRKSEDFVSDVMHRYDNFKLDQDR